MCDVAYVLMLDELQRIGDQNRIASVIVAVNTPVDQRSQLEQPPDPEQIRALLDAALLSDMPADVAPAVLSKDQQWRDDLMRALGIKG